MLTKRFLRGILLPICLLLLGCADEEVPFNEPPQIRFGGPETECLSTAGKTIETFLVGDLSAAQLTSFWDCLNAALTKFQDFTRGEDPNVYKSTEILRFLEDFFLGDLAVSAELLSQVMHIKRLLVGGGVEHFTRDEIAQFQQHIEILKSTTLQLNPHMKVIYSAIADEVPTRVSDEQFEMTLLALDEVGTRLLGMLSVHKQDYSFNDFSKFLDEIHKLINSERWESKRAWIDFLPFLFQGKLMLVGGPDSYVDGEEWPRLIEVLVGFLKIVMRVQHYVSVEEFGTEHSLRQLHESVDIALTLLFTSLEKHAEGIIDLAIIEELVRIYGELYGLPLGLDVKKAKEIIKVVIDQLLTPKLIGPEDGKKIPDPRIKEGIGRPQLETLDKEFRSWADGQYYVVDLVKSGVKLKPRNKSASELEMLAFGGPWRFIQRNNLLYIDRLENQPAYDSRSLTALNWQRAVIRIFIKSFAMDPRRKANLSYLTPDEVVSAQVAVEPIGVALGLFEPGDTSLAGRIVQEANMFMPRADGDNNVSYAEGVEYLAFIISGLTIEGKIGDQVGKDCGEIVKEHKKYFEASCFRDHLNNNFRNYISHLPGLVNYFEGPLGEERWQAFAKKLEITLRKEGYSEEPILRSDIMEMWILLQYIENFFIRFDLENPIEFVNVKESLEGYKVFQGYLKQLLEKDYGFLGASGRRAVFTYLFKYGEVPTFRTIGRFLGWWAQPKKWEFEADRARVLTILSSLSAFQKEQFQKSLFSLFDLMPWLGRQLPKPPEIPYPNPLN